MRLFGIVLTLPVTCLLWACSGNSPQGGVPEMTSPFGPTGVPERLRPATDTVVTPGGNMPAEAARALENYDPKELLWTDPDDADAELTELESVFVAPRRKSPWLESETEALRESKRTGKPLVIWFTDDNSPECKNLSSGLLTRMDFETWAEENTIRLVVNQSVKGTTGADTIAKVVHNRDLKKKYKATGHPSLHVLMPSGEVIGRYKSYRKGREEFFWGQLKQGVSLAQERHQTWKADLEKKGYRDWSNGGDRVVFAKLTAYRDGNLVLVEPDGRRLRTREDRLSSEDRTWIRQQKEMRGIQ